MIYLDYNATTPVDPAVLEAMLPFFAESFGNPASAHGHGDRARVAVEEARERVSDAVNGARRRVTFTSGATEANNLVLRNAPPGRVLVSAAEHKSVLEGVGALPNVELESVPVTTSGTVDVVALRDRLDSEVSLVSVMWVNNETGVINPLAEVVDLAHAAGALVHSDATQAVGRVPVDCDGLDLDLLTLSSHKLYGPKGAGAVVARRNLNLEPLLVGGGQEGGIRAGTLNVPAIVGFGVACELAVGLLELEPARLRQLRDRLHEELEKRLGPLPINGSDADRVTNTLNMRIPGADGEAIVANARTTCFSTGSACTASEPAPSHVLLAMGLVASEAWESVRFSLGRFTTGSEIEAAAVDVARAVEVFRAMADVGSQERDL